jgi:outer membrane protein assembly factor BamD
MRMPVNRSLFPRALAAAGIVLTLAAGAGCGKKEPKLPVGTGDAEKFLMDRGNEALAKKRWLKAREYYRRIVDDYPQSRYRPDAKLGLGDTYIGESSVESLILAANEFKEFLTYYPTNERAYYAQYKLALAHFDQMLASQRDQTQTKEAVKEFENFVERYPDSPLIADGRKKLRESRDRMSAADYQVGYFYYRARWYPGAIARFRTIMANDPEYTSRDAVYFYLAECLVKMRLNAEALPLLDRLSKEFEKSEYLQKAKRLQAEIESAPPEGLAAPVKKKNAKGASGG